MSETSAARSDSQWTVRETFKKWELLRLIYNLVLIVESLIIAVPLLAHIPTGPFVLNAALAALGANLCFFLGPAVESYVRWLGWYFRGLRYILFAAGLLFSMWLAVFVMVVLHLGVFGLD